MPVAYTGQLTSNEIYSSLYNMIISQEVFSDRLQNGSALVDKARVDGGLFGDTKLYYAADILETHPWGNDAEAANLLALDRPADPYCQAITLDEFKQIRLTLDNYLSKRAWSTEGAFGQFNSVMESMVAKTKEIYDETIYNVFIGITASSNGKQSQTLTLTGMNAEERAKAIAECVANLLAALKKPSRSFNDLAQMTRFNEEDVHIIWNSKYVNEIRKVDTPAIFHREGLVDKFSEDVIHEDYFGSINASSGTGDGATIFAKEEGDFGSSHLIAGEVVPKGVAYGANETYTKNSKVICKILVKLPPFMSAFQVGTEFFNPRSLTRNRYLTWGHNTLDYLAAYPFITLVEA